MAEKLVFKFEIMGLPKMSNEGLRGTHWSVKAKEAKNWKNAVMFEVINKINIRAFKPLEKARLVLTRYSSTSPDADGLVSGFKHVIDGLVKAGVLANDKFTNIGMPDYRWEKCKKGQGKIRVEVYAIEEVELDPDTVEAYQRLEKVIPKGNK